MPKYFYTSDSHFGHKNILKYCNRPFSNVTEMDEALISNWNKVVRKDDIIYHLGDVAFCCDIDYALSIMKKLNGIKHLIVGNHDQLALQMNDIRPGTWASINQLSELIIINQKFVLCHYPMRSWNGSNKNSIHLFGHVHGNMPSYGKSFDVGVDCWNYTPVSFNQVIEKANSLNTIKDF